MGRTTPLRTALKTIFYPLVEARGFVIDTSHQHQFTVFRRQLGADLHLVEIQWDKSGRPRFVINFGRMPIGAAAPDEFQVHHCRPWLRLQRWRGRSVGCWFQLRRSLLSQIMSLSWAYTPEEVAHEVVACFAEVEAWFESDVKGPHVHALGDG